jgi:hypothetical protein
MVEQRAGPAFGNRVASGDRKLSIKAVAQMAAGRKGRFAKPEIVQELTGCIIWLDPATQLQ